MAGPVANHPHRRPRGAAADRRVAPSIRAASCSRMTRSSAREKSARCASFPSWCSSTAATWRRGTSPSLLKEANYDRAEFASGVAEALIKAGVRCVVAAGWAVDDEAARVFATTFYTRLLAGRPSSTPLPPRAKRRVPAAATPGRRTSATAILTGSTGGRRATRSGPQRPTRPRNSPASRRLPASCCRSDTLAVKSEYQGADPTEQAERLRYLEADVRRALAETAAKWRKRSETHGRRPADSTRRSPGTRARAIAPDGAASLAAIEQLANLKVRRAWEQVAQTDSQGQCGRGQGARRNPEAIALLDTLLAVEPTVERESSTVRPTSASR